MCHIRSRAVASAAAAPSSSGPAHRCGIRFSCYSVSIVFKNNTILQPLYFYQILVGLTWKTMRWVVGLGFGVAHPSRRGGVEALGLRFGGWGLGFRGWGLGFRVSGLGFRV